MTSEQIIESLEKFKESAAALCETIVQLAKENGELRAMLEAPCCEVAAQNQQAAQAVIDE